MLYLNRCPTLWNRGGATCPPTMTAIFNCTIVRRLLDISAIPDEILAEVFVHYVNLCDFQGFNRPYDEPSISYEARALLCTLSHRLRNIAIQLPQLWTYIQLPRLPPGHKDPPIWVVELWLRRSGILPIHVDLYGSGDLARGHPGDHGSSHHAASLIEVLRPHLHRWRSFKIFFGKPNADLFAELPLESAVNLEKISVASSCPQSSDDRLLLGINKLPALQSLFWDKYYTFEEEISSFKVAISDASWRQLHDIRLSCMLTPDEMLQLFSNSTSAVAIRLKLRRNPSPPPNFTNRPLIKLQNLRVLEIFSDLRVYEILQYLDLPNLEIFRLSALKFQSSGPHVACERFTAFLNRSNHSLKWLMIDGFTFSASDASDFFANPQLVDIPVLQISVKDGPVYSAAKVALDKAFNQERGVTRILQVIQVFWLRTLGWVDEEVKRKYFDGLGYRPNLGRFLDLK